MTLRRLLHAALGVFLVCVAAASAPAKPVRNGAVVAELVSAQASIQPGQPFWVAVKLTHDEHWHSYWINAGTGYPTSITWTLPAGFTAGPIVWPTPHTVKDTSGKITGNGYEGTIFLFTQITPPADLAPGSSVTLKAATEWLMCKDSCMPGDAQLELTRPVKTEQPEPDMTIARAFNNARAEVPAKAADWAFTAQRDGAKITLRITPRADGNTHEFSELHYFDEAGVVDYAVPQTFKKDGRTFVLEMAAAADAAADAPGLKGVLTAANGFGGLYASHGALIDELFVVKEPAKAAAKNEAATAPKSGGNGAPPSSASGSQPSTLNSQPASLLGTLFLAFVGGLILNLMPCVFPVLGIKIMGFVNQSGSDKRKVVQHGVVFAAGVLVSFWSLAGVLLALRSGGAQLGWGFQLQSPAFVFGMATFLLVFALNMSGLFEVGLSATGAGANLQAKEGLAGSFFTGALATLVATPCSAPFLAPALGAALTLSPVESLLVFTAIAVGLALPYLLLSIFPQAIKILPRPGAWMETFKQFMAFPLYATVGWLLWVLAGQTSGDDYALLNIAFGFVLVAMAAWAYGRFGQTYGKPVRQLVGKLAALALFAGGLWLGWPKDAAAAPVAGAHAGYQVTWEKWSPEAIAAAQKAGKFVYVDFTARWCATCQTNKATVFHNDDVLAEFGKKGVVLLRGDWTNKDPLITAELARWNRSAVPFNLIYAPNKKDPVVLPELLTPGKVLDALAEAAKN
ncbi:protein-disulfide reductase DsbD family protein [Oleiharenicola sp. Vm1]|uniref:protein-disulfide reductase DsbD family protein n=1 Tax=Oleiharenicola sp. Vm1 TaxID=3398393 RepID=UPI0039F546F9